ncbi:MAG: glycosyltransferase family A protein [Sphingomicrobium sp.]
MSGPADENSTEPCPIAFDVSVVMPVYNALPHLDAAIESVLAQTHGSFEFVILDDASTDGSAERLRYWAAQDPRIRLIATKHNLGPAMSSQKVAAAALAPIVARMDADDISYPDRLSKQLDVLRQHPEAGVVGSLCDFIDDSGKKLREPESWRLSRHSALAPFAHGTMMYRSDLFEDIGGYREECIYWEDQDLTIRMAKIAPILIIPQTLYRYRLSTRSIRITSHHEQVERSVDLMYRSVDRAHRGEDYDDLLAGASGVATKVDPRVFISLGSQQLWAGGRPRMFRRMLRRGNLRLTSATIIAAIWTGWASASPSSLRSFLRLLILARNTISSARVSRDLPVVWHPPGTDKTNR